MVASAPQSAGRSVCNDGRILSTCTGAGQGAADDIGTLPKTPVCPLVMKRFRPIASACHAETKCSKTYRI